MKMLSGLLAVLTFSCFTLYADDLSGFDRNERVKITKEPYTTKTWFPLESETNGYIGMVTRGIFENRYAFFGARTVYNLFDSVGNFEGSGYKEIFSFSGMLGTWGADFNVYDASGNWVGRIDGSIWTTAEARYDLIDKNYNTVGQAYLNDMSSGFNIVDPQNQNRILVRLSRKFVQDDTDYWTILIHEPDAIDPIIIKTFAAFAVDCQAYFKADN